MILTLLALLACGGTDTLDAPAGPPAWPLDNMLADQPPEAPAADPDAPDEPPAEAPPPAEQATDAAAPERPEEPPAEPAPAPG